MSEPTREPRRFASLHAGRGIAAMLVMMYHATILAHDKFASEFLGGWFWMGNAGVDFFFVLSGFVIYTTHADDLGRPERAPRYLRKRFVRVFPPYWVATMMVLPVYFLAPWLGQGDERSPGVIVGSLLLIPMDRPPILVVAWSLIQELLFYGVFAGLIVTRGKWYRVLVLAGCVVLTVLSARHFREPAQFASPWSQWLLWPQNIEFAAGVAAGWLVRRSAPEGAVRLAWAALAVVAGVLFLATGALPHEMIDPRRGDHVLVFGGLATAIVLALGMAESGGEWRNGRGLRRLGDASFAVFLVHAPVMAGVARLVRPTATAVSPTLWVLTAIFVAVAAGLAFHQYIERPMMTRWLNFRAHRPVNSMDGTVE